jgi:nucleoside-diphosphate-sugar epimerase
MRIVIIGGTGHVGTYLVPRLVAAGHEVICLSRGTREPYTPHAAWNSVSRIEIDREAGDKDGTFAGRIRDMDPEAVVDMVCFKLESARQMVEALKGHVQHYLFCGSIWMHGYSVEVPTVEDRLRQPLEEYGIQKDAIDRFLADQSKRTGFPATSLHPGHIVGPGWNPVNPQGNFNPEVFNTLSRGEELHLPNFGLETVHHVHADDVAQGFMRALERWSTANGEGFHLVSSKALTLRGYAEAMARWFGQPARLRFEPFDVWAKSISDDLDVEQTETHIAHSPNCSIEKARSLLGYQPRYSSLQAVQEAVTWLIDRGIVDSPWAK